MIDLEIPLGKRTRKYRFFEMVPALLSYGAFALLIILSIVSPLLAAIFLLIVIISLLVRAVGIGYHTIAGRSRLEKAQKIDWSGRLLELEDPVKSYSHYDITRPIRDRSLLSHVDNLRLISADESAYPKPSSIYHAVIIATYNEPYEVLEPTITSLLQTSTDNDKFIVILAYEGRAGQATEAVAQRLKKKFENKFFHFDIIKHPELENEVKGKGSNITYAGYHLKKWLDQQKLSYQQVVVTTLDSDNRPYPSYFDYLAYEFIVHDNRKHLSFQPVALFTNNIWDVPAMMRVIATGNSFWNIISSMRPHTLRNFASHSQPMEALVEMDFWSTRTIVEDGHQYWRSYFYFGGNYEVIPLYIPIYQDAVLDTTLLRTLRAQFVQLRRWAYGASDVPYVAVRVFSRERTVPFWDGFVRLVRLIDGHVTLACVSIIVAIGGWLPLFLNPDAYHDVVAHQLPDVVSFLQTIGLTGLFITIFLSFKLLPPRPARYKRHRTILMVLQWVLMPITAIVYSSSSALYSQTRLLFGRYLERFDVTAKVTAASISKKKSSKS